MSLRNRNECTIVVIMSTAQHPVTRCLAFLELCFGLVTAALVDGVSCYYTRPDSVATLEASVILKQEE